ncbi:MAG: hypothetical protein ACRDPK_01870 [Carbonactinosporaceae bacterium]
MSAALVAMPLLAVERSKVTPGLLGFLVVVGLAVATWFLVRSMSKQIGKIDFDERDTERHSGRDSKRSTGRRGSAESRADREEPGPDQR